MKRTTFLCVYFFFFLAGIFARPLVPAMPGAGCLAAIAPECPATEVKTEQATFYVSAMDTPKKVKAVETQLYAVKGVTEVKGNLITRTVTIGYRAGQTSKTRLAAVLRKIGMEALPVDNGAGCPVPPAGKRR